MPHIAPLPESDATDKTAQTYGRIKELLGTAEVPLPFTVYGRVPAFLQDFFMNFKKFVHGEGELDARTRSVVALAVSGGAGSAAWTDFFMHRCRALGLTDGQLAEVLAVASTNYMYNTFFKFRELSGSDLFAGMGVGLRAHTFAGTSLDEKTVELINLAVSDINACKPCVSGHVEKARQLGLSNEAILETIQCAAVMLAGAQFLKAAGH